MNCPQCGAQLPEDASFCYRCGAKIGAGPGGGQGAGGSNVPQPGVTPAASKTTEQIIAPTGATSIKCPNCGAPISPKFGEMVITCEYCGSGVVLGNQGWTNIQKHTVLSLKVASVDQVNGIITPLMDKGLLHRHLQQDSKQEEMSLSYVPYWLVAVSARTSVVAANVAAQVGQTATTAALMGIILGGMGGGGGRGGFGVYRGDRRGKGQTRGRRKVGMQPSSPGPGRRGHELPRPILDPLIGGGVERHPEVFFPEPLLGGAIPQNQFPGGQGEG